MYTWGINSAFDLAEAVSRAGGCQALKDANHKEHKEEPFFTFVVFVPLWCKAFMLFAMPLQ